MPATRLSSTVLSKLAQFQFFTSSHASTRIHNRLVQAGTVTNFSLRHMPATRLLTTVLSKLVRFQFFTSLHASNKNLNYYLSRAGTVSIANLVTYQQQESPPLSCPSWYQKHSDNIEGQPTQGCIIKRDLMGLKFISFLVCTNSLAILSTPETVSFYSPTKSTGNGARTALRIED